MQTEPTVYVVDDDPSVLKSLRWLIESAQLSVKPFSSARSFLESYDPHRPGCLILDVRMPGMSGLDLQSCLADQGSTLPVILMTGNGDVPACTRAFKSGAFDFIEKPANDELLLTRIRQALAADAQLRTIQARRRDIAARIGELTRRELEIMQLIVSGKTQKQIAMELEISIQTAAKHRAKILEKLKVENDVELTRLANAGSLRLTD